MFGTLHSLSDSQIVSGSKAAREQEHEGMVALLGFLVEIERRQIHLTLGYSSLFSYCTQALGYSEAEAMLRITAARCVAGFPEVLPLLEAKEVKLSTVQRVSKILSPENCSAVLARVRRKSLREVEAIAAEYEPTTMLPKDRVRTVVVRVPVAQAAVARNVEVSGTGGELRENHLCNSGREPSTVHDPTPERAAPDLQLERRSVVQFCADNEFMTMLDQIRCLASHELSALSTLQDVMKIAMRYYIKHRDPSAREARREARKNVTSPRARNARAIAAATRDRVFTRDDGRCTYVAASGRRCESRHTLQIDHIQPVVRGGAGTIDNLRLLCAHHNRLEAERLMGRRGPGT